MHLCAELIAASMTLEPLGEVGAYFSLQLSSRTQFTKINKKKLSPKFNVKNIKKIEFRNCFIVNFQGLRDVSLNPTVHLINQPSNFQTPNH